MFPPGTDAATVIRTAWAAHGMSVVELGAGARATWTLRGAGPAQPPHHARHRLRRRRPGRRLGAAEDRADPTGRRVRGTMNNCAGGTTPWGTVLSGEENFNQYFNATGTDPREVRYGLSSTQDARNWRSVDPRWDATTRRTPTSRTGSAGSSRSTRSDPPPRRSSTRRWAASSTRAPT